MNIEDYDDDSVLTAATISPIVDISIDIQARCRCGRSLTFAGDGDSVRCPCGWEFTLSLSAAMRAARTIVEPYARTTHRPIYSYED